MQSNGRTCTKCWEFKLFEHFPKMQGGFRPRCKPCHVEDSSAWAAKNHDRYIARLRSWYDKNERRPRVVLTPAERLDRKRKQNSAWAYKNKERLDEMRRDWARRNKHAQMEVVRRRQIQKSKASPAWADREKMKAIYKIAVRRTKFTGIKWVVDHIVPIKSKLVCGLHVESNLQVMPLRENAKKGNRYWPDMPSGILQC